MLDVQYLLIIFLNIWKSYYLFLGFFYLWIYYINIIRYLFFFRYLAFFMFLWIGDSFFLLFFFILNLSMTIFAFFLVFTAILNKDKARLIKKCSPILNILKLFFLFLSNIYYFPFFNLVINLYFDSFIYCFNKLISWNYILRLYCRYYNVFLDSLIIIYNLKIKKIYLLRKFIYFI